jgi:malonyl-CoA O-methyltransferase
MLAEEAAMRRLMPDLRDQIILDLACGSGRYGRLAIEAGARLALGVDHSAPMMIAGMTPPHPHFILAPLDAIPLMAEQIDGVLCGLAIGHVPEPEPALNEITRVLRPGGWALISDFHPFLALTGHHRTFTAAGKPFRVEHYPHLISRVMTAARAAGLTIDQIEEPMLPVNGTPLPAVIVYRMFKTR